MEIHNCVAYNCEDKCCRCLVSTDTYRTFERRHDGLICNICANKEMIYLATPYSHPNAEIREIRFKQACVLGAKLIDEHHRIFSPIVAYHPMSWYGDFKTDWNTFESFCRIHMSISTILYIAKFNGWDESIGIKKEKEVAKEYGLPIFYIEITNV